MKKDTIATPTPAPYSGPLINIALAAIMQDIVAIAKDRKNEAQGFKFRGIDDMYNELHPIFSAHGVVCIPTVESAARFMHENKDKKPVFTTVVTMIFAFRATDGSEIIAKTIGEGSDFADKSTGKALSMAHKYLLIQTFLVPTADIDDADVDRTYDAREEMTSIKEEQRRAAELERQAEKLAEKRESAAATPPPAGATQVPPADLPPKPEKAATKPPAAKKEVPSEKPSEKPAEKPEPKSDREPWRDHVITAISAPKYNGKRVEELTLPQLELLESNWSGKAEFEDAITADAAKSELRTYLRAGLAFRRSEAKK